MRPSREPNIETQLREALGTQFHDLDGLLPPCPASLARLERAFGRADTSIGRLAQLIEEDPALTVQVLRVANSAFYGLPREIRSLKHAVAFLGQAEIRRLVFTQAVLAALPDGTEHLSYVRHAAWTALLARQLAPRFEPLLDPTELWPCAMLHDLGRLVLVARCPETWEALSRYAEDHRCSLDDAEAALGLMPRRFVGALLAHRWGLPGVIVDTLLWQHLVDPRCEPGGAEEISLRRLVGAAADLATLQMGGLAEDARVRASARVKARLAVGEDEFASIRAGQYELHADVERIVRG